MTKQSKGMRIGGLNIGDLIKIYFICALILMCTCWHWAWKCIRMFDSCIRGHHISKDFWIPVINEELVCAQEGGNPHDPYAVMFC